MFKLDKGLLGITAAAFALKFYGHMTSGKALVTGAFMLAAKEFAHLATRAIKFYSEVYFTQQASQKFLDSLTPETTEKLRAMVNIMCMTSVYATRATDKAMLQDISATLTSGKKLDIVQASKLLAFKEALITTDLSHWVYNDPLEREKAKIFITTHSELRNMADHWDLQLDEKKFQNLGRTIMAISIMAPVVVAYGCGAKKHEEPKAPAPVEETSNHWRQFVRPEVMAQNRTR